MISASVSLSTQHLHWLIKTGKEECTPLGPVTSHTDRRQQFGEANPCDVRGICSEGVVQARLMGDIRIKHLNETFRRYSLHQRVILCYVLAPWHLCQEMWFFLPLPLQGTSKLINCSFIYQAKRAELLKWAQPVAMWGERAGHLGKGGESISALSWHI